ncbi:TIGR03768 family metallophosphoesterase [Polymorphobacter arshaanensis]|uniref:TIGR03768 family metallophosphoesterase n=1 Tax=Glacieibacterium arshaanense TaxID=2511025 RepID=A0A4Y9ENU3_9SPHN|nr:TIGR03768 family metallophosphoesterase [Polymorphobacter arshaanensis]TFU03441.1 TIGR03768 family metallophosphoesterase [Polymorphobacter arshaanensis]
MPQDVSSDLSIERRHGGLSRRAFLRSTGAVLGVAAAGGVLPAQAWAGALARYPIATPAVTTRERMLTFPAKLTPGLAKTELNQISRYDALGYGEWSFGAGLPVMERLDLMPAGYARPAGGAKARMGRFFTFSDVHITDKEAPNQLILFQQTEPTAATNTSIYSPVMPYTTQVLDAAVQTVNDLHSRAPFDFGLMLGDACNNTAFNEIRWYVDVLDGQRIVPSSGAHLGTDSIGFQKPFQAAGLDKSIPWYQVMGNHDHFLIGSFPFDADPALGFRQSYTADRVWSVGNALKPDFSSFPPMFDYRKLGAAPRYFPGVLDGASANADIIHAGSASDPAFAGGTPRIAPDPARRPILRAEWVNSFFDTQSHPAGHGFNRGAGADAGFTCYSFVPKAGVPLKIIVLDVTQSEADGSVDIHGHGYLDARRWAWLQAELARGQADNQLMIIAAHVPIGVSPVGSKMEWWAGDADMKPGFENAVDLAGLVATLQATPNLLMWIAGHRHFNTVKAFPAAAGKPPEQGFWQVETSSLRDFPQQFRTFEISLNSDYSVSVEALNVDIAVAEGTPAAQSRKYAVAAQQIIGNDLRFNSPNFATAGGRGTLPIASMDPTRPQSDDPKATDPSNRFVDLSAATPPVPYHASCNVELVLPLSPAMVSHLRMVFPVGP